MEIVGTEAEGQGEVPADDFRPTLRNGLRQESNRTPSLDREDQALPEQQPAPSRSNAAPTARTPSRPRTAARSRSRPIAVDALTLNRSIRRSFSALGIVFASCRPPGTFPSPALSLEAGTLPSEPEGSHSGAEEGLCPVAARGGCEAHCHSAIERSGGRVK
jgi:hypothetical protein